MTGMGVTLMRSSSFGKKEMKTMTWIVFSPSKKKGRTFEDESGLRVKNPPFDLEFGHNSA